MAVAFRTESDRIRSDINKLIETQSQNADLKRVTSKSLRDVQTTYEKSRQYLCKIDPKLVGEARTSSSNKIVRFACDVFYSIRQVFAKIFLDSGFAISIYKTAESKMSKAQALAGELQVEAERIQTLITSARSDLAQAEKQEQDMAEATKAANLIQKLYRGHQGRKQFKDLKDEAEHRLRREKLVGFLGKGLLLGAVLVSRFIK